MREQVIRERERERERECECECECVCVCGLPAKKSSLDQ